MGIHCKDIRFGKATHANKPAIYNLTDEEKLKYNKHHRHLAHELRNIKGSKQSSSTDAFSVERVRKSIGHIMNLENIKKISFMLKTDI